MIVLPLGINGANFLLRMTLTAAWRAGPLIEAWPGLKESPSVYFAEWIGGRVIHRLTLCTVSAHFGAVLTIMFSSSRVSLLPLKLLLVVQREWLSPFVAGNQVDFLVATA